MITVDINIVLRLLTQGDELQFAITVKIFQTQDIFMADTVILQTEWVLRFAYQFEPGKI